MFIVVEGIDGSGKTTLIEEISKQLAAKGYAPVITSEFGSTLPWSGQLRQQLMENSGNVREEYATIMLARYSHYQSVLEPHLSAGHIVLMDRYQLSTIGYQGQLNDMGDPTVREIIDDHQMCGWPVPDLTILLDCDPGTAYMRSNERGKVDAFDSRGLEFFKRARELMCDHLLSVTKRVSGETCLINAERPFERVTQLAMESVNDLIKSKEAA
jgi:dTMP kinase